MTLDAQLDMADISTDFIDWFSFLVEKKHRRPQEKNDPDSPEVPLLKCINEVAEPIFIC